MVEDGPRMPGVGAMWQLCACLACGVCWDSAGAQPSLKLKAKAIEPRSFILPVVSPKPFCQPSKMLAKTLLRRSIPSAVRSMCSVRLPVTSLSEEEEMFRSSVAKFAKDVIAPRVREMDENSHMDTAVLKGPTSLISLSGVRGFDVALFNCCR